MNMYEDIWIPVYLKIFFRSNFLWKKRFGSALKRRDLHELSGIFFNYSRMKSWQCGLSGKNYDELLILASPCSLRI
jgi:hypothetical protein